MERTMIDFTKPTKTLHGNTYVALAPRAVQNMIEDALRAMDITGDDLDQAMNSKLSDLTETLPVIGRLYQND